MPITYVAGTKSSMVFNTNNTVPAISSVAGDTLLAFGTTTDSGSGNTGDVRLTPPDGTWTRIGAFAIPSSRTRIEVYAKTATGPLAQTLWKWTTSHWTVTGIVAYRGAITPTVALADGAQITYVDTPAQTPTAGDFVVIAGYSSSFTSDFGPNPTKRLTDYSSPRSYVVADLLTGAPERFTATGTTSQVAASLLLKPEGGGGPAPRPASTVYAKGPGGPVLTTLSRKIA